ncbi:hypothetical protein U1P98_22105 [Lysinibacillus irui]|uniref:Uncharacterized protein n=1 Tax=Lysinibacillus irui TaxID=2998077 RepID=A0AAJ5RPP4_9BACI|nr:MULTISPECIES: hypothetical protein [Lysinibacillus]MEA0553246.1 hypothetical protein [Lysinibacillus irui]MEA0978994.1 hypothetical protein [Lysinibacillus irui]MEA1045148.1 hypothetical protein [Lysinibacillus irui]WDV08865.1 hypothetical protein OU989_10455 [Lysinibacillus irui]
MAIGMVIVTLLLVMSIVFMIGLGKSKKTKCIIWGITIMIVIAPLLSWLIAIPYGISEGDGFAAVGLLIILFPILFLSGLVTLLIGIFKKNL